MKFQVHNKEKFYLAVMTIVSLVSYSASIALCILHGGKALPPICFYIAFGLLVRVVLQVFLVGYIRGNAIKITSKQFPDIFTIVQRQSRELELKTVPDVYILQGNGSLNAFATKFAKRNYVILLSNVLEAAYQEGMPAVAFIIGHELGHIQRNHVGFLKSLLLFPAQCIPFLSSAYSRACEYTCDGIGESLCPQGAQNGLLVLAAGTHLYKKINIREYIFNAHAESGFVTKLTEKFFSHPHLTKRLIALGIPHAHTEVHVYPAQHDPTHHLQDVAKNHEHMI